MLRKNVTGMNQQEFALACSLDVTTLRKLERNQMSPDLELLGSILHLFGLQLSIIKQDRKAWRWSAAEKEYIDRCRPKIAKAE
ncbi:helix-turn-helix domain-containing protein [Pseudomonas sp. BGr12]|uniref:helix-turn-helix domain-containing protein n=1 Tax=Pseudomonas sp. BGr12 TaxID=2936269 RepID=UPI002559C6CB|nr:helix-turn-helix transcriptional regulator [Pseudomonas sp. BJa5]MDL2428384.1 helix-turn-helix domain-containing protein [Pseudomonas sp. BJa5]